MYHRGPFLDCITLNFPMQQENQSPQMFDLDVDDEFTDGMSDPGQILIDRHRCAGPNRLCNIKHSSLWQVQLYNFAQRLFVREGLKKVFFQRACRIILGPQKQVLQI